MRLAQFVAALAMIGVVDVLAAVVLPTGAQHVLLLLSGLAVGVLAAALAVAQSSTAWMTDAITRYQRQRIIGGLSSGRERTRDVIAHRLRNGRG